MKKKVRILTWLGALLIIAPFVNAQETDASAMKGRIDAAEERLSVLESDMSGLKKLKISGYVQARYEIHQDSKDEADTTGKVYKNLDYFYIRRGRVKVTYEPAASSRFTLQLDAAKDKVTLKDAEAMVAFPIGNTYPISLRLGQFKWPFSYDVLRSSSEREMPERTRAIRALMPGERDRGVQLGYMPNDMFDFNLGLFNGYGIDNSTYPVITPTRTPAIVGRATADFELIAVGASVFTGKSAVLGTKDTINKKIPFETKDKNRFGGDAQLYYELPVLGGGRIMAEVITGKDWSSSKKDYANSLGGYLQLVQNIWEYDQIMIRYDIWDPDGSVEKDGMNTLGLGLVHHFSGNAKLTLAYEMPKHQDSEKEKDDNFLTAQLQVKF